ncbi:hypothetical protein UVI_02060810 [Ustilaginoidea virens]|uniref:Uncharacterized protein n=1 Tax=Ustilaginoidea virens TaxID=1159556 RepID=A0A1B5L707_USTVR|nr:hypothetical protein UVI_02060810 [Ustilaginoidea virens]
MSDEALCQDTCTARHAANVCGPQACLVGGTYGGGAWGQHMQVMCAPIGAPEIQRPVPIGLKSWLVWSSGPASSVRRSSVQSVAHPLKNRPRWPHGWNVVDAMKSLAYRI